MGGGRREDCRRCWRDEEGHRHGEEEAEVGSVMFGSEGGVHGGGHDGEAAWEGGVDGGHGEDPQHLCRCRYR